MTSIVHALIGFAMAFLFSVPVVSAQDALGSGNILDNQLGGDSRSSSSLGAFGTGLTGQGDTLDASLYMGANGVRDLRNAMGSSIDFRIGNLMVTGSVAGSKNFRGDVGYMASSDFRAPVGSDAIFNELQGSALSQIQFVNSPFSNDRYTAAMGMGAYEYRRDYTPAEQIYTVNQASEINQDRIRLDRTNAYASSRNLYDTAVNASSLRLVENEDKSGLYSVEYTPLQGIYTRKLDGGTLYTGLSFYDRVALASSIREGETLGVGDTFVTPLSSIAPEAMLDRSIAGDIQFGDQAENKIEGNILSVDSESQMDAYQRVVRELVVRYGDDESVRLDVNPEILEQVKEELDEVRELTMGLDLSMDLSQYDILPVQDPMSDESTDASIGTDSDAPEGDTDLLDTFDPGSETEEEREERLRAERTERLDRAAEIIRNGGRVTSFSAGQKGRIRQLMIHAEERLKERDFFDAETRFDQVLRINPGNPLALYGRANAQLGAGLYLSSALSLRKLYTRYPELIGTDLAPEYLPGETRLRLAVSKLKQRIKRGSDLPSYGLCLAYAGRLLDDQALIRLGFSYMDLSESDEILAELLGNVWLTDDAEVDAPELEEE